MVGCSVDAVVAQFVGQHFGALSRKAIHDARLVGPFFDKLDDLLHLLSPGPHFEA